MPRRELSDSCRKPDSRRFLGSGVSRVAYTRLKIDVVLIPTRFSLNDDVLMQWILFVTLVFLNFTNIAFFSGMVVLGKRYLASQSFDLGLRYLKDVLAEVFNIVHLRDIDIIAEAPCCREHLAWSKHKLVRSLQKNVHRWFEFIARSEQVSPTKDIKTKTSSG